MLRIPPLIPRFIPILFLKFFLIFSQGFFLIFFLIPVAQSSAGSPGSHVGPGVLPVISVSPGTQTPTAIKNSGNGGVLFLRGIKTVLSAVFYHFSRYEKAEIQFLQKALHPRFSNPAAALSPVCMRNLSCRSCVRIQVLF